MDSLVTLTVESPTLPAGLLDLVTQAKAIVINSPAQAQVASTTLAQVKAMIKQVDSTFVEPGRAIDAAKRTLLDAKMKHRQPLEEVESYLKNGLVDWRARQDAEQAEAQRQAFLAAEAARKKAEQERAEAQRRADIAHADAVRAAQFQAELEADMLREAGRHEEATAVVAAPVVVAPVVVVPPPPPIRAVMVAPAPPPPTGISYRVTKHAVVDNLAEFALWAVGAGRLDAIAAVMPVLNEMARKAGDADAAPPGVRFVRTTGVAAR
ncbi:MAG: hypothetical protein V1755_15530 [Chloroflexota bacterium]